MYRTKRAQMTTFLCGHISMLISIDKLLKDTTADYYLALRAIKNTMKDRSVKLNYISHLKQYNATVTSSSFYILFAQILLFFTNY